MSNTVQISVSPDVAFEKENLRKFISSFSGIPSNDIIGLRILKRSLDARNRNIKYNLNVWFSCEEEEKKTFKKYSPAYCNVKDKPEVVIAGAGPAGLFAALRCIELGLKPIVFDRGKEIEERKTDIANLNKKEAVNPDSNYCFGEGGAGTFSDGKLYTRSKKRGNVEKILNEFVYHGADENILIDSHPHIGSDKLGPIIISIRNTLLNSGAEIYFNKRISDINIKSDKVDSISFSDGTVKKCSLLILATGHSAYDIYELLEQKKIETEIKGFAMGVRIEHPQVLIDEIRYHGLKRDNYLPAAEYSLVTQINNRGVYSFCMCPGGIIVPAKTDKFSCVVNGMSNSKRNSAYANSGIVVEIRPEDINNISDYGFNQGLLFRKELEQKAYENGGENNVAPAQRMTDFCNSKLSNSLPKISFLPGCKCSNFSEWMPEFIFDRLKKALVIFGKENKGFYTQEAVVTGVESGTSSPVRIPRNPDTFCHIKINGLYPCGEGAGYSGGIISSAVDGQLCVEKIKEQMC